MYKGSEATAIGTKGTYTTNLGGTGLGYRMPNGDVVRSGGNGFYYPVDGLESFTADGGRGYMGKVAAIAPGWVASSIRRSRKSGRPVVDDGPGKESDLPEWIRP